MSGEGTDVEKDDTLLDNEDAEETEVETTEEQTQAPEGEAEETADTDGATSLLGGGDDDKPESAEGEAKDDDDSVPEKYEDFELAEGFSISADQLEGFKTTAKELGLSQKKAQKMISEFASMQKTFNENVSRVAATKWAEQTKSDPELGGAQFKENVATARKAYRTFASKELQDLLNKSGLGSHPEVIRLFVKVGKAISQDSGVVGEASAPSTPRRRFPNSNMVADLD